MTNLAIRSEGSRNKIIIFIVLVLIVIIVIGYYRKNILENNKRKQDIISHYNRYVITNENADIYILNDSLYEKVGMIGNNQELMLDYMEIDYNTKYFRINYFGNKYYIKYDTVDVIDNISLQDNRYKRYVVYNKNIVTRNITNFYDEFDNLIYVLPESFDLPIVVNKQDKYGVEYNGRLLYVKNKDVLFVKDSDNTSEKKAVKIPTLVYHRVYDPVTEKCTEIICHTEEQFETHMKYLSDNNYFSLTTQEMSDFIDGYINLPEKSVMITIDDGTMDKRAVPILEKYKINAVLFLVTIRFNEQDLIDFTSDYLEVHSHSHNMHWAGECAGYGTQGGAILCWPEEKIIDDLKKSSEILNGSTVFCYPFYDYDKRAINLLKEAGYMMAFAGLLGTNGYTYVGTDKMLIPRIPVLSYTTLLQFKSYIS